MIPDTTKIVTVGFWGNINFFHEHRHDIPPMKIYNVGVCLVQFLKFFMEPFWRNCNFKILTLNPGFSALKCKNPLKSTILSILGMLYGKSGLFFIRKKILVWSWQLYREKMVKNAFQIKNLGFLKIFDFQNVFQHFSVFDGVSTPVHWTIWTGFPRRFFWVLKLIFYLLKSLSNDIKHFARFFLKMTFSHSKYDIWKFWNILSP